MKTITATRRTTRRAASWLASLAIAITLLAGCVTTDDVKSIVANSNASLLAAQMPDIDPAGDPAAAKTLTDPTAVSREIDEFVAAHPDQAETNSALRIRQAMLFLAYEKYELARDAFAQATKPVSDRDKALKKLSDSIIWWWQHARVDNWDASMRNDAASHLGRFDAVIKDLGDSPGIHDTLAEMRARLAFHLAKNLQAADPTLDKRAIFINAMNQYGALLTAEDVTAIKDEALSPQSEAFTPADRRRLRALGVIEKAKIPAKSLRNSGVAVTVDDLAPEARGLGALVLGN